MLVLEFFIGMGLGIIIGVGSVFLIVALYALGKIDNTLQDLKNDNDLVKNEDGIYEHRRK